MTNLYDSFTSAYLKADPLAGLTEDQKVRLDLIGRLSSFIVQELVLDTADYILTGRLYDDTEDKAGTHWEPLGYTSPEGIRYAASEDEDDRAEFDALLDSFGPELDKILAEDVEAEAAEQARLDSLVFVHGPWEAAELAQDYPGIELSLDILNTVASYFDGSVEKLFWADRPARDLTSGTNFALGRAIINPEQLGEFRPVDEYQGSEEQAANGRLVFASGCDFIWAEHGLSHASSPCQGSLCEVVGADPDDFKPAEPAPLQVGDRVRVTAEPFYRLFPEDEGNPVSDIAVGHEGVVSEGIDGDGDLAIRFEHPLLGSICRSVSATVLERV